MIKKYFFILFITIIYACATVQSPTGGEKDEKAPILYESNPKDQSTNFNGTEIKLFFNEWMKLEQLNKELIITPREEFEYESTLKKQELIIKLKKPLKDSTTYTFNFRKALSDITEGNVWENPVIAFSTGDYLDSLEVEGTVTKLFSQEPAKSFVVGLYDAKIDTANLRQGKPVYFTTTDETGYFKMQNIKVAEYIMYAFQDKNNNLINNSQTEPFGFYTDTLNLKDSIPPIKISTYMINEDTLKLKKYSPVGKDFVVQYNKGLSKYNIINPNDPNQDIYANDIEQSKYIKIYKENFPKLEYETDSVLLYIEVQDSISQSRLDTVYFQTRESRIKNDKIKIIDQPKGKILSGQQEFIYKLSKPIYKINYDSIQLRIDTIPIQTFTENDISLNFNKKIIGLRTVINESNINSIIDSLKTVFDSITNLKDSISNLTDSSNLNTDSTRIARKTSIAKQARNGEKSQDSNNQLSGLPVNSALNVPRENSNQNTSSYQLQLYIGQGSFIGLESDSTVRTTTNLNFKKIENYGIIKGTITNLNSDFIIELLTEKYEVVDTIINTNQYQFNYVEPANYRIRVIEDSNENQKWDAGNPLTLTPSERIYYLNEIITVKANWEVIDKNFDFSVDKSVSESE